MTKTPPLPAEEIEGLTPSQRKVAESINGAIYDYCAELLNEMADRHVLKYPPEARVAFVLSPADVSYLLHRTAAFTASVILLAWADGMKEVSEQTASLIRWVRIASVVIGFFAGVVFSILVRWIAGGH